MASQTFLTVATYRGIAAGWVPVGQPRPAADAARLLELVRRIRVDHVSRAR
jgi:hypothetical protein